jgi:transglutaminase-like putative cysteine protease
MMPEFLSRRSLSLIVITYALITVMLFEQSNIALILMGFGCVFWRVAVFTGRVNPLRKAVSNSIAVVVIAIILVLIYKLDILSILVNAVLLGFSLKFLELKSIRDVHFFTQTGLILVAIFLVFNNSILMASIATVAVLFLLMILLSIHGKTLTVTRQFNLLSKVVLFSLPLAIILFIVLPRLPSIWQMPLQNKATTGLSDTVTPGSIAELSQSPALAFRVSFDNQLPLGQAKYWRVLTLDQFDGKTWSQSQGLKGEEARAQIGKGNGYELLEKLSSYQLILEPHYKHYIPSLDFAYSTSDSALLSDFSLRSSEPVFKRQAFAIEQYKQVIGFPHSVQRLKKYTQLPINSNPQTREWIEQALAGESDKFQVLDKLLTRFSREDFSYTLKPPPLGEQQIDDFLFSTHAGFCVHYASAYLFVARALNIPSRMVTGYLGGEWDKSNALLSVRQYDAHAWVEIWKNEQWQRIDPTAYVAPERVEQNMQQSLDDQSEFLAGQYLSLQHWKHNALVNQLSDLLDRADYFWAVWVINYDNTKQLDILKQLLSNIPWLNLSVLIMLLLLFGVAITMLWVFKPWKTEKVAVEDKCFNDLYKKATVRHLVRKKGQTISQYCHALVALNKGGRNALIDFAFVYNQLRFKPGLSTAQRKLLVTELFSLQQRVIKQYR